MTKNLMVILTMIILLKYSINDYILPFKTVILSNNETLVKQDFLSNIFSRRLSSDFLIGSNSQNIQGIINMSQVGFYIYDNTYNYNSSSSFKYSNIIKSFYRKNHEKGYDANDTFCFIEYNSNMNLNNLDIKKCKTFNNVNFELLKSEGIPNVIKYYYKYALIGLGMHGNQDEYQLATFIRSLKNTNMTNSHFFSFNFFENQKNGDINGYLYIGKEKFNESKGIINKVVSFPINGQIFWNLKFKNIHTAIYDKMNSSIFEKYKEYDTKIAELIVDMPYIIAIREYRLYITEIFFREFINKDICFLNKIKLDEDYSTFVCDNSSKLFREKLENEFPVLKFQHYDLNTTFILNQYDLFTYNYLNKSDTNIYFLVLFSAKEGNYNPQNPSKNEIVRWKLGIPFFKKYKFRFNADSREINYYEQFNTSIEEFKNQNSNKNLENPNKKLYLILGIGGGVLLLIIFFVLGFLCHKKIIRLPRKKKANELDDEYEYSINHSEANEKKASLNNHEVSS